MESKKNNFVAPNYICPDNLPYASDIFYHKKICYFLPTGFIPSELKAVANFPEYCLTHNKKLPLIICNMFNFYFRSNALALTATSILKPLQNEHVNFILPVYPRGIPPINTAKKILNENPCLYSLFMQAKFDMTFISRELLGHFFLDPYNEIGNKGLVEYIEKNIIDEKSFYTLLISVMINRFRLFTSEKVSLIIYERSWYKFLIKVCSILQADTPSEFSLANEEFDTELFCFKLFESILFPIYGKIDTERKAEIVAKTINTHNQEILALKTECRNIALKCALIPKDQNKEILDEMLKSEISKCIIEPLNQLLEKPQKNIKRFISDVLIDSGTISGLLSLFYGFDSKAVILGGTAATISTSCKMFIDEKFNEQVQPSKLLCDGMKNNKKHYFEVQKKLQEIAFSDVSIDKSKL